MIHWTDKTNFDTIVGEVKIMLDNNKEVRRILRDIENGNYLLPPTLFSGNVYLPEIKRVIYHKPATVIVWKDGTKSVVKCDEVDEYSKEVGYLLCVLKKILPNKAFYNILETFYTNKGVREYE